jgi:hypothetical protein
MNLQRTYLRSRWRTIAEKGGREKEKGGNTFPHAISLGKSLKEFHYGLVECLSAFKVNEMTSIGEGLQLSSSNALRQ